MAKRYVKQGQLQIAKRKPLKKRPEKKEKVALAVNAAARSKTTNGFIE
jgi:hypothetical protein